MDLLKQELNRKRRLLESEFPGRKLLRQSELHRLEIRKIREKELQQLQIKKSKSRSVSPPKSDLVNHHSSNSDGIQEPDLTCNEVIRRLRVLKQPVTLFGEDDVARFKRLESVIETGAIDIEGDEIGEGQTNDFLRDIYELREKQYNLGQKRKEGEKEGKDEKEKEKEKEVDFDNLCEEEKISVFFKRLLNEWGKEVEEMSEAERRTAKGKSIIATHKQCARYLDPLFKMCKKKALPSDIKKSLVSIVSHCLDRDYRSATDQYIRLAIGNAPWPIGVTMVGIHARSAREKIHANSVAHIMNDETTRKYLQSVKRLVTFCQRKYPTDPSWCVEFNGLANGSDLEVLMGERRRGEGDGGLRLIEAS